MIFIKILHLLVNERFSFFKCIRRIDFSAWQFQLRIAVVCFFCIPVVAVAHHSIGGRFDTASMVDLEGEITKIFWRNPHVGLTMKVSDADGKEEIWKIEAGPASTMRRMGLSRDIVSVGDRIKIAGHPPTGEAREMFVLNLMGPDNKEVLMTIRSEPRWSNDVK